MNLKVFPFFAGAMALSMAFALPACSQTTNPAAPPQRNQMRPPNFLNLTADQQTRFEQIRQNERSQIGAILTADQKAQLQRDYPKGELRSNRQNRGTPPRPDQGTPSTGQDRGRPRLPFASLNLTAEQRSRIEAVQRTAREQMDAILTPEQRQQMQQHMQQHQQRRQNSQANQSR